MAPTAQLDLSGVVLAFEPVSHWRDGDWDAASLIAALKKINSLKDRADENGNMQSRVRVDAQKGGFWITIPATVDEARIDDAIENYEELEPEPAPPNAFEMLHRASTKVQDAKDLDEVKSIFADMAKELEPMMGQQ